MDNCPERISGAINLERLAAALLALLRWIVRWSTFAATRTRFGAPAFTVARDRADRGIERYIGHFFNDPISLAGDRGCTPSEDG
jgi:hypothetical protein